jgi:hypothetical protein
MFPDPQQTLDTLRRAASSGSDHILIATVLWALSLCGQDVAAELDALGAMPVRRASSMGLGLALTATAVVSSASPQFAERARAVAIGSLAELTRRFSPSARLFRAISPSLTRGYVLHHGVTSFASQVYPLHGIAQYVRAFGDRPPVYLGEVAANLVDLQGRLGQWWWLYSERSGHVLEGYPVYSVHQDAMAFMALLPLQSLGLGRYDRPLSLGLAWMEGDNELGRPLVNKDAFVYRAIQRRGSDPDGIFGIGRGAGRAIGAGWGLRHPPPRTNADPRSLEVLRECRPYHLGWILLARSLLAAANDEG